MFAGRIVLLERRRPHGRGITELKYHYAPPVISNENELERLFE